MIDLTKNDVKVQVIDLTNDDKDPKFIKEIIDLTRDNNPTLVRKITELKKRDCRYGGVITDSILKG